MVWTLNIMSSCKWSTTSQSKTALQKIKFVKFSCGNIPSDDNFIQQFAVLYKPNEHGIQDSLVTLLLKALVTKMAGKKNARYDDKVRNFFISLAASGNKHAYEFVSGNLGMCMTHRHARKCISAHRSLTFINLEDSDIISIIENHVRAIRDKFQNINKRIAFSVGIDATVLVKTFQYSSQLHAIIGGVYPNNCINVAGKSSNELNAIMKDCLETLNNFPSTERPKMTYLTAKLTKDGLSIERQEEEKGTNSFLASP